MHASAHEERPERGEAEELQPRGGPRWANQAWMDDGLCRGRTDLFFAPHAERPQTRLKREARARVVCQACPVIFECRRYARTHLEYGFWGGESEDDRRLAGCPVPAPIGGRARRSLLG